MTLTMYDSTDVANLPEGAQAYAGYVGGQWPTWVALKERFAHPGGPHLVSVAIDASEHAICLDVEKGDATAGQAPAWVKAERSRGVGRPILYTSAANVHALIAELKAHGHGRGQYRIWSAHYGAGAHICGPDVKGCGYPAADGTQWRDDAPGQHGTRVDESLLKPDFFGLIPAPAPKPVATEEAYVVPTVPAGVPYKVTRPAGTKAWS